jgi:hypothetical protein
MHLPSLATVTLLLATQPWRAPFAGWLRGILLTTSLLGASMLLDLNALYVAATTDAASRALPWQEHPLGLFLLCDGVLAQGFAGAFRGESPRGAWQ